MPVYQPDVELFEQGVQHPRVKLQIHILGQIGQESADAHGGIQSFGVGGGREERVVCAECNNQTSGLPAFAQSHAPCAGARVSATDSGIPRGY